MLILIIVVDADGGLWTLEGMVYRRMQCEGLCRCFEQGWWGKEEAKGVDCDTLTLGHLAALRWDVDVLRRDLCLCLVLLVS